MQVLLHYTYGPFHVPSGSNLGVLANEKSSVQGNEVNLHSLKVTETDVHELQLPDSREPISVIDAEITMAVAVDMERSEEDFLDQNTHAFLLVQPLLQHLRILSSQPQLEARTDQVLEFQRVTDREGRTKRGWQKQFLQWEESRGSLDQTMPFVSEKAWARRSDLQSIKSKFLRIRLCF